jgi:glycine/D-amino acid oxidase-like deaminating enzyme
MDKHIVVIGAGIIGASIAYHAAKRGGRVTLLEKALPAGEASGHSFAWINASAGNARPYYDLRLHAIQDWHRLERELEGAIDINWGGRLEWCDDQEELLSSVAQSRSWGYPMRLLKRHEIEELEPNLAAPPEIATLAELEGTLDPPEVTAVLLERFKAQGGELITNCEVRGLASRNGGTRIETRLQDALQADHLVIAAGKATQELAGMLDVLIPMKTLPGCLMVTEATEPLLNRAVMTPGLHMKQMASGEIMAGEDFGGGSLELGVEQAGQDLLRRLEARLKTTSALTLAKILKGIRPIPKDGWPVIGPALTKPQLYIATMHSGVTLAALTGRLAAQEILDAVACDLLDAFRPSRFGAA